MTKTGNKKKVVVKKKTAAASPKPTVSRKSSTGTAKRTASNAAYKPLYKRENFIYMFAGLGLILLGYILMAGGGMPDPNTWDESIIYSARRITLAPILITAGLVLQVFAIFK